MNVLFHTTTAACIAVALINTKQSEKRENSNTIPLIGFLAFFAGIISHGVLDYLPHCYPINSKLDAVGGLAMILLLIWRANKKYRIIICLAFFGAILPDLVDLAPQILNDQLGLSLPLFNKIFPWHWPAYSGSIYKGDCSTSNFIHILLLAIIGVICWYKRRSIKTIFNHRNKGG